MADDTTKEAAYVTNAAWTDGFGSQFQNTIQAAVFAELNNLQFAYTPFIDMEHNYDNEPSFLEKKEKLINFKDNFPLAKEHKNRIIPQEAIDYFDNNISKSINSESLKKIKRLFRANKPDTFFNNNKFNIAIHIRRPNSHDSRLYGADIPDDTFMILIDYLKTKYFEKDYLVHIYSQGNEEQFKKYLDEHTVLHLNESIEDTFTSFVFADVLFMSPSALSYIAGLLSEGEVYYMPFWLGPSPNWKIAYVKNNKAKVFDYNLKYKIYWTARKYYYQYRWKATDMIRRIRTRLHV